MKQHEPTDSLPQEYRELLIRLLTIQADSEIGVTLIQHIPWVSKAPTANDMWIEAKIVISLEKTATNGFADLRLSVKSKAKSKTPTAVVKYDGKQYDLAPWNHVFGTWWEGVDPDAEP